MLWNTWTDNTTTNKRARRVGVVLLLLDTYVWVVVALALSKQLLLLVPREAHQLVKVPEETMVKPYKNMLCALVGLHIMRDVFGRFSIDESLIA